jgi:hypothetical protein
MFYWLFAVIIFILDIWAIVDAWSSPLTIIAKILWTLLIIIFPVLGLILYWLFGATRVIR